MDLSPNQFQSAGSLPVYQGGVNTGTNWGENTGFTTSPAGVDIQREDFGGGVDINRRRQRKSKEDSLVPSALSLPAMATAATAALALPKAISGVISGLGSFVGTSNPVTGALRPQLVTGSRAIGGGLEDLSIAAKEAGSTVTNAIGRGAADAWNATGVYKLGQGRTWEPFGRAAFEGANRAAAKATEIPGMIDSALKAKTEFLGKTVPNWVGEQISDYYRDFMNPETKKQPTIPFTSVEVPAPVVRGLTRVR